MRTPTTTRQSLIQRIVDQTGLQKKTVQDVVDQFLEGLIEDLAQGHRIEFRDFGVFDVIERAPRRAQNPSTLERVDVPARKVVRFRSGRRMTDLVAESKTPEPPAPEPESPKKPDSPF